MISDTNPPFPAHPAQPLNVLYLEDNLSDRELVEAKLRAGGIDCNFFHARTRDEFEGTLTGEPLDLILSDFALPAYGGNLALTAARRLRPEVPFLFVSGTIGEERAVESLKSGATDYVIKDHLERLIPAVRRALRESRDRSRRRIAEQELRASEERFRMVFENAPIGVINADAGGTFLSTNRTLRFMLGYTEAELLGMSFKQITHEEDQIVGAEEFVSLMVGRVSRVRLEKRFYRKDDSVIWAQITTSAIRDNHNQFQYFVTLVEDLSERKQAEERMRDQATLLDMAADAIIVQDAESRVITWNHGAERLYGWTAQEVIGRRITELYPAHAGFEWTREELLADGDWSGELRQLTREGKLLVVSSRVTLMRDTNGLPKSVLIINTDITEKKNLEMQFLRAQRMESIGTLASGIAHDLNNILAPISIASQILRMKPLDKEAQELVDRIEASAHRGAGVVRQVLTFARGIEGERALLQPRHLIKEIINMAQDTFPKNVSITYSVAEDLWPVIADATQLHQVLLNLFVNARDAMPSGGQISCTAENALIEDTRMLLPGAKAGPYALIQVKDTGVGIPADIMEKIFEPFFTTKELGKGTGLGLSTVLGIVKSHGGSVIVYSEPGKGATFKIYLPATADAIATLAPKQQLGVPRGRGQLILLVDDESAIRDVTRRILVRHGYNVVTAVDGVEGLAVFAQQSGKIDLIITDIMMPRMEGVATVRALKKLDPNVKILASSGMTGMTDHTARNEELKSLGVVEILPKPCSAEKLLSAVHQVFA
ncbi:MAG TPA: PAS domain S-box protein [Verrucomicrobiae bacterium]|jgi:PAS domain S-box-containing protein|nr:PAS domain S-box protein [Verrucomicrobiae bacterium]